MSNQLSYSEFKTLKERAEQRFKNDFNKDPRNQGKALPSISEIYGLPEYTEGERTPLSYYLVRDEKTRKFLVEHFKRKDQLIKQLLIDHFPSSPILLKALSEAYSNKYIHRKAKEFKKQYKAGIINDSTIIKLMPFHQRVFEIYSKSFILENEMVYDGYYFSTTDHYVKKIELTLNLLEMSVCVSGFHDTEEDIYPRGTIHIHESIIYITAERYTSAGRKGDLLHINLYKGKKEKDKIQNLPIISGSFLGTTTTVGLPIASEVIFVKRSKESNHGLATQAKRHINLKRNRIKVFNSFLTDAAGDYLREFGYSLSELDSMIGTYKVGRVAEKYREISARLVVSTFRLNKDYSATLYHPVDREKAMNCALSITGMSTETGRKTLIVKVYGKNRYNPLIVLFITVPKDSSKDTQGKYCGVTNDHRKVLGGDIVLYKVSDDPLFEKETMTYDIIKANDIAGNSIHEKLARRLGLNESKEDHRKNTIDKNKI